MILERGMKCPKAMKDTLLQLFENNCHYEDLLRTLSNGQSNKLTKIVSVAKSLFDVSIYYPSAMHAANINKLLGTK
jgi:hypothetical protein